MNLPITHEELLAFAIKARVSVIHEFSTDIRYECRKLKRWAARYAEIHDLKVDYSDKTFGIYHQDEEQDQEIAERIEREERNQK